MGFLDPFIAALGSLASELFQALNFLFSLVVGVFEYLGTALNLQGNFFYGLFGDTGNIFSTIWNGFFKGIFTGILAGIIAFGKFLAKILGPVLKFLRSVSVFIDRIYRRYIRPLLAWIRIARVFLQLLKALGVKWAGKLDNILGTIQHDIQNAFLLIKGYLNVLIDVLNILVDPTNLLRRPTTLLSIMRISHAAIRMFTGLPPGFFIPSNRSNAPLGLGFLPANFDPNNPLHNPPASYYLAFDGGVPDFGSLGPGDVIGDDAADSISPLNYFADTTDDILDCLDANECRDEATRLLLGGI